MMDKSKNGQKDSFQTTPHFDKYFQLVLKNESDVIEKSKVDYPDVSTFVPITDEDIEKHKHLYKVDSISYPNEDVRRIKDNLWMHKDFMLDETDILILKSDLLTKHDVTEYFYYSKKSNAYKFAHLETQKALCSITQKVLVRDSINLAFNKIDNLDDVLSLNEDDRKSKIDYELQKIEAELNNIEYPSYWHIKFSGQTIVHFLDSGR